MNLTVRHWVSGGVRWCVGNFSDHCTPEQRFQSQANNGLFEACCCRKEAGGYTNLIGPDVSLLVGWTVSLTAHITLFLKVAIEVLFFHVMILSHIPARCMI